LSLYLAEIARRGNLGLDLTENARRAELSLYLAEIARRGTLWLYLAEVARRGNLWSRRVDFTLYLAEGAGTEALGLGHGLGCRSDR
jgi:hypothetical protein